MNFQEAITAMLAASSQSKVGMVMRWDHNDNRMWTFYSSPRAVLMPPNLSPVVMSHFTKDVWNTDLELYEIKANTAEAGLHAEEIMFASWDGLVAQVGAQPQTVEIILSKSCCHGDEGSSPMTLTLAAGNVNLRVFGCSLKLAAFIDVSAVPKWVIRYYDLAGSKDNSTDLQRHQAGAQYIAAHEQVLEETTAAKDHWQQHVPANLTRAPAHIQQGTVEHNADKRLTKFERDSLITRNAMRHESVMQAQSGIVKLEAIAKVDIARILTTAVVGQHIVLP